MTMRHKQQQGQVLVIFAGSLIALLAIAAVVIDLGFVFIIHRQEQNAADPGALAAARYIKFPGPTADTGKMFNAACFYARQNGYFANATNNSNGAGGCVAANDNSGTTLTVNYPPSTSAGDYAGRPGFVEVVLTQTHESFFAGLLGIPRIPVSSGAVGAFNSGDSNSNSLVALKPDTCGTLQINGGAGVTIQPVTPGTNGGYIMVDSNCANTPDNSPDQCSSGGQGALAISGNATVTAPAAYVVGSCKLTNNPTFSGTVDEGHAFYADPLAGLIGPPASGAGAFCAPLGRNLVPGDGGCQYSANQTYQLQPGVYYGGIKVTSPKPILNFNPGIYIMAGGGFNPTNGEVDSNAGDIMIYSTDVAQYYGKNCPTTAPDPTKYCQGTITINGSVNLNLSGLNVDPCPPVSSTGCPYVGILFWQDGRASIAANGGSPVITINGGTNLRLSGTIYNPAGDTTVNGGSSTTGCTGANQNCASIQVISNTIKINGGSGLNMPYDPSKLYHLDNQGLVH